MLMRHMSDEGDAAVFTGSCGEGWDRNREKGSSGEVKEGLSYGDHACSPFLGSLPD
jgi:hypothetical protein